MNDGIFDFRFAILRFETAVREFLIAVANHRLASRKFPKQNLLESSEEPQAAWARAKRIALFDLSVRLRS
jgi:hypothetical protein